MLLVCVCVCACVCVQSLLEESCELELSGLRLLVRPRDNVPDLSASTDSLESLRRSYSGRELADELARHEPEISQSLNGDDGSDEPREEGVRVCVCACVRACVCLPVVAVPPPLLLCSSHGMVSCPGRITEIDEDWTVKWVETVLSYLRLVYQHTFTLHAQLCACFFSLSRVRCV